MSDPVGQDVKTAEFHVCTGCGVVPVVTSRIEGGLYAVVNVNAFENVKPALLQRSPSTFEGENEQARLSRRKHNWIADVHFEANSYALGNNSCSATRIRIDGDYTYLAIRGQNGSNWVALPPLLAEVSVEYYRVGLHHGWLASKD